MPLAHGVDGRAEVLHLLLGRANGIPCRKKVHRGCLRRLVATTVDCLHHLVAHCIALFDAGVRRSTEELVLVVAVAVASLGGGAGF
jgi:hypothetical protein